MMIDASIVHFIIFALCTAGASYTAYTRGVTVGAEATLDILEAQQVIKVNENGEIEPYK